VIRSKNHRFDYRKALVGSAIKIGVKPTARAFGTTPKTVRLWLGRYLANGPPGLAEQSRRPKTCPHKTSAAAEARVLAQRRKTPGFSARRLKYEFDLTPSIGAIGRILRQHGLTRKPKKKHQTKHDLREIKKKYAAFTRFKMDVKYLNDIPHYWPYMTAMNLPRYEYTISEVRVGAVFLAFSDSYGVAESEAVVRRLLVHLRDQGVPARPGRDPDRRRVRVRGHGDRAQGERLHPHHRNRVRSHAPCRARLPQRPGRGREFAQPDRTRVL